MKISKLREMLDRVEQKHGDIETTMIGTTCPLGYSMGESQVFPDVFESTIEGSQVKDTGPLGKRLHIYWQI